MDSTVEQAARLDLVDMFALRRVSAEQLVNLAGVGRGEGWAGNISIDPAREPLISRAMETLDLVRHSGETVRIFGPYWTDAAAAVMVGDFVVVMGGPGVLENDDNSLLDIASDLAWSVGDVSAEKRLADELEVTKAALTVASLPARNVSGFLACLADAAIEALSCEFGAVVMQQSPFWEGPELIIAPTGWQPSDNTEFVLDALLELLADGEVDGPLITQDLSHDSVVGNPLGFDEGLVSRCIIPIGTQHFNGAIVVAHTVESPRGFTGLCRRVAVSIGDQATQVLDRSFAGASGSMH